MDDQHLDPHCTWKFSWALGEVWLVSSPWAWFCQVNWGSCTGFAWGCMTPRAACKPWKTQKVKLEVIVKVRINLVLETADPSTRIFKTMISWPDLFKFWLEKHKLRITLLWASYSSWRHQYATRLNCGWAYLHGCTIVQRSNCTRIHLPWDYVLFFNLSWYMYVTEKSDNCH